VKRLREVLGEGVEIIGLGTKAMATGAVLKTGANKGLLVGMLSFKLSGP
jgi:hypothetical protein